MEKKLDRYISFVKKESRPGDAAQNSMFIVAEAELVSLQTLAYVEHPVDK